MITNLSIVLNDVAEERKAQDKKWGVQNHNLIAWLAILAEEFGEAARGINEFHFRGDAYLEDIRLELIQTAAVAVAIVEYIDRTSVREIVANEIGPNIKESL